MEFENQGKREIIFRAWNKDKKSMSNLFSIYDISAGYGGKLLILNSGKENFELTNDLILMQFTGLRDCKENKIFEGDIVKDHMWNRNNIYAIIFNLEQCSFCGNNAVSLLGFPGELGSRNRLEIIGNVYENPELFKKISK